eukprot:5738805-Pleurochrysis_carterae.AAC.1
MEAEMVEVVREEKAELGAEKVAGKVTSAGMEDLGVKREPGAPCTEPLTSAEYFQGSRSEARR